MKTSTIRHRVADFLKQHAPFQFIEPDDLMAFAGAGRVRFHEKDEEIFRQDGERKPFIWVIRQGAVELHEEEGPRVTLRDLLGEGELLGIGRFTGAPRYLYSAKTAGDVLLYAFPVEEFEKLVRKYRFVERYLQAYFSVTPNESTGPGETRASRVTAPAELAALAGRRLLVCRPDQTLREVAWAMRERDAQAALVADEIGRPLGVITWRDFRNRLADGALAADDPASVLISRAPPVASTGLMARDYQLEMMRRRAPFVVLTSDGSASCAAEGLLSAADVSVLAGANPALLTIEALRAESVADLAPLVALGKALAADTLGDPAQAEWTAHAAGELNAVVVSRLVDLAEQQLVDEGLRAPSVRGCWLFFGGAGRRELMTWVDLDIGLVYQDADGAELEQAQDWFSRVAERLDAGLEACGYSFTQAALRVTSPDARMSLDGWRERFAGWIREPIRNRIYESRSFFDLRPVCGDRSLAKNLRDHMLGLVAEHPEFLTLLANDCLSRLPPLTFFHGLVVADSGAQSETLDLRRAALFPLMDVARVLGLSYGESAPGTFERFAAIARHLPDQRDLLAAATEAYRVALTHRGRTGLAQGDDGSEIRPSALSKFDQQVLKGSFRSVLELLNFTRDYFKIEVSP